MFYAPFWILMSAFAIMAIVTIIIKGFHFVDFLTLVMVVAVSLIFDMIFCKWLQYYSYVVTTTLKAFYSLMFCLIGYPAIGITFLKFLPSSRRKIALYIAFWITLLTLIEIYFTRPYGIVIYPKWHIIPYSPIIYLISLTWEYGYYKILHKRLQLQ